MKKKVNGEVLWGAGETIHKIGFTGEVNLETKEVEKLKFEMDNSFFDDMLQGVFEAGNREALRLANA